MILKVWVQQNNEQSPAPGKSTRSITFGVVPEVAGKDPEIAGGKIVGAFNLQNVPDAVAATFAAGAEFDVSVTPRAQ